MVCYYIILYFVVGRTGATPVVERMLIATHALRYSQSYRTPNVTQGVEVILAYLYPSRLVASALTRRMTERKRVELRERKRAKPEIWPEYPKAIHSQCGTCRPKPTCVVVSKS